MTVELVRRRCIGERRSGAGLRPTGTSALATGTAARQRMRWAIAEIVRGSSFGRAAHVAGFADQAHFGHDFRRTFGAAAGISLTRVRA